MLFKPPGLWYFNIVAGADPDKGFQLLKSDETQKHPMPDKRPELGSPHERLLKTETTSRAMTC